MTEPGYKLKRDKHALTVREREVLKLLRRGKSQKKVAIALGLTKQRVNQIVKKLIEKKILNERKEVIKKYVRT